MKRLLLILLVLILGLALIPRVLVPIFPSAQGHFYDSLFGSALAALFAAFLVWVAWQELTSLGKTSSADFIHRLNKDFFTARTRRLFDLMDIGALEFVSPEDQNPEDGRDAWPYFRVNRARVAQTTLPDELARLITGREYYSSWEIDDMLLGHFEDIGNLERRRIVDFGMVDAHFGFFLTMAWENRHIQAYLQYLRTEYPDHTDNYLFCSFEYIAKKCQEYSRLSLILFI
ncbi:MAG: hypothetical protein ABSC19_17940 [Syntrophorhabdales bacterium]